MKKKSFYYLFYRKGYVKFFRIMKLCFLFMLLGMLSATAKTIAQNQVVSLHLKNVTYLELFNVLHKETGVRFLYSSDQLENLSRIDVVADRKKISEVLEEALRGTNLICTFEEDMVMLRQQQQQITKMVITGGVKDTKKQPLPGVTVLLKGMNLGAITDADGHDIFTIPTTKDVTLVFSFVGMKTKEVPYRGEKELNVVLEENVAEMDEVVVTGIFNKARESYTGSVTTISSKEIKMFRGQNMLQTLRNIDPSFNIVQNNEWGSDPNKLPEVNIRGNASLPGSLKELNEGAQAQLNTPLVIMDGFEISLQKLMDFNDDEIESINIMKDASATAIYGSRGANGVIVVTTKKPQAGKLKVFVRGGVNLEIPDLTSYDLLNAREKLALEKELGFYDSSPYQQKVFDDLYSKYLKNVLEGTDTYWLSKPLRTGVGQNWNFRLEGGNDEFRWSGTLGYRQTVGVMKNSDRNVLDGTINLSYTFKNLIFQNQTSLSSTKSKESNYGSFSEYVRMNPYWRPYDESGKLIREYSGNDIVVSSPTPNPLYNTQFHSKDQRKETQIINNFSIEWNILSGLIARAQFGLSKNFLTSDRYKPAKSSDFKDYDEEDFFRRGNYTYGTGENLSLDGNVTLSYSRIFAEKHSLYAGVNYSINQSEGYNYSFVAEGFLDEKFDFISNAMGYAKNGRPGGTESISRRVGFTGNLNYTYDNRYYADFSYRVDGGSQFGSKNKFAPFWSAGIGWNIHREHFMASQEIVTNLRLKGSLGNTGSQQFDPYKSLTMYQYNLSDRYALWNGDHLQGFGNENLKWQSTMQYNGGLEIGLWNNRVSASLDVYTKETSDMLSELELPLATGFPSYTENVGSVRNKGWEAMLSGYIFRNTESGLLWSVTGKIAYNKNEIIKLSDAIKLQTEEAMKQNVERQGLLYEGQSVNSIYVVRSLGIDPSCGEELFLDKDGNRTYKWNADSRQFAGISEPKYRGNLSSMFAWKDLTLNLSFGYHWGGQQYNSTVIDRVEVNRTSVFYNVDRRVLTERWMKPGDVVPYKKIGNYRTLWSSRFVQDDNMFSLQSVSLSYRWNNHWLKKNLGMQSMTVGANLSDLFYISTIKRERGLEYPFARQMAFDVSIVF